MATRGGAPLNWYAPLRGVGRAEIRLFREVAYSHLCYADGRMLATQLAYGIPADRCPVLRLEQRREGELFAIYRSGFDRLWSAAGTADLE